ncbi:MAG: LysR family transcriptional regulator [Azonexaceae bacterium]|uniref:LysR family transcriptional regulator n=1 Tax=Azonexus sp. R2A61 TaxID=2744443 RepID=UPI001F3331F2|nr:LysR family transcriptional regulator [Azonexus sp. R2A61]MCE1240972.1 LysR family transcriptional regulator [Azonexaceae bacterium]
MNQLEDMRMFAVTADTGSFTAAAERLGVTKQFISRRIMALEKRLGARLLVRTTRKLSVTDTGRSYHERAVKILEAVDEAEQLVADRNAAPRGSLRISAPMSFGTLHLGPAIAQFMRLYPEVRIELDLSDRFVDIVGEGYDLALRIGELDDSSLVARQIALTQLLVCASPDYLARRGTPQTPEDLQDHDCLLYGHSPHVEWRFKRQGKPFNLTVNGRLRANNGELACAAAIAGVGVVCLPSFIVGRALRDNRLHTVLDTFLPPPLAISAVYPQHRQTSQTVRAFTDFLRNTFGKADFS